jgi:hypothetical protein
MFLACHSGSCSSLASSLAMHVALVCRGRGWEVRQPEAISLRSSVAYALGEQCRSYAVALSGSEQLSSRVPEW